MENKEEIKVKLSTVIYIFIIVALIIALGITYYFGFVNDKNAHIEGETVTNTTENTDIGNKENDNKVEENKVNNTIEKQDNKYKEITKKLDGIDGLYVTEVIKNKNKTYTLKGVLYSQYKISHKELRKILNKGKMSINSKEYIIKEADNDDSFEYKLIEKDDKDESAIYEIYELNDNEYFLQCNMNITDVWELTEEYRQITIPVDKSCKVVYNYGSEAPDELTVEEAFGDYKKAEPEETSNPWMIYNFEFKNGKVIEVYNLVTAA